MFRKNWLRFIQFLLSTEGEYDFSRYKILKRNSDLIISLKAFFKNFFLITIGVFSASFGFKGFLLTNRFIDGGATGISLLISLLTDIPLQYLIVLVNIPFIFLAFKTVNKVFAIKTIIAISGLAICLAFVDFPNVTNDKLLVAVFGGVFLGAGIGFSIRGGAVIDGTEVLAIYLSKKMSTSIGDIIFVINVFIFSAAAYFLSLEIAMYSMITYLAASKMLDFIVEGIEEYVGITVITSKTEEVKMMIFKKLGRGVTVYNGKRGFGKRGIKENEEIIFTVITRLELSRFNTELQKIAPNAFVVIQPVKNIKGGLIKKRVLKH